MSNLTVSERPVPPHIANANKLQSLVACLLKNGNTPYSLTDPGLARIGHYQGFSLDELKFEFAKQQAAQSLTPCNYESPEGK